MPALGALTGIEKADFRVSALCSVILYVAHFATTWQQGAVAVTAGTRPPEDAKLLPSKMPQGYGLLKPNPDVLSDTKVAKRKMLDAQWRRILLNDLENIPLALILFWASILVNAGLSHMLQIVIFTGARLGWKVAYIKAAQPARLGWKVAYIKA